MPSATSTPARPTAADPEATAAAARPFAEGLHHPAIDAALSTAATLLGMEVVFIGGFSGERFKFERVRGSWGGLVEGESIDAAQTFCARMLESGQCTTTDALHDPIFAGLAAQMQYEVTSYVGVPITDSDGQLLGTLCGIDHGSVPVEPPALGVLRELAGVISAHLDATGSDGLVIRRNPDGWSVSGADARTDLTSAMVLADLICAELAPGGRPPRPETGELSEVQQLRLSVSQLEHALAARVMVEQAIGVLAERQHSTPRAAFDRLRKASRSRGRKVHDLAREVVASVTDHGVPLPPELAGR